MAHDFFRFLVAQMVCIGRKVLDGGRLSAPTDLMQVAGTKSWQFQPFQLRMG
jgi:hypothetical protein